MKMNTKRMLSILLTLAMLIGIFPAVTLTAGADDGVYVSAETIEAGKTYVLVADGQFALNNQSVDWGSYANSYTAHRNRSEWASCIGMRWRWDPRQSAHASDAG